MVNCGIADGALGIAAVTMANSSDFINGFGLAFNNPSVTTRNLIGLNDEGEDDINFQNYPSAAYMLDYTEYTYDAAHEICNTDYKCSNVSFTLLTYNSETMEVSGYFSGKLYEEANESNWNNCKTPDEHSIEGYFNLYAIGL
jgi:hypothetical protein